MIEQPALAKVDEVAKVSGPGARLKLAREARHISIDEVAKQLRLTAQRVGYIEADDYAAMGAPAFAKGYLRGYARFLGMSEEETVQTFDELGLESAIQSNKPELIHEKITPAVNVNSRSARRIGYVLLLAIVACSVYWWYNHSALNKNNAADKAAATEADAANQPDAALQQSVPLPAASPSVPAAAPVDNSANTEPPATSAYDSSNAANSDSSATDESAPVNKKSKRRAATYQE